MSDEPFPYAEYRDNNNKPLVKKHKTCSPRHVIEARCRRLYKHQLEGKSARQIVVEHMKREGISMTTAYRDWNQVLAWIDEDWKKDRESMMARIQAMRMELFPHRRKTRPAANSQPNLGFAWAVWWARALPSKFRSTCHH